MILPSSVLCAFPTKIGDTTIGIKIFFKIKLKTFLPTKLTKLSFNHQKCSKTDLWAYMRSQNFSRGRNPRIPTSREAAKRPGGVIQKCTCDPRLTNPNPNPYSNPNHNPNHKSNPLSRNAYTLDRGMHVRFFNRGSHVHF